MVIPFLSSVDVTYIVAVCAGVTVLAGGTFLLARLQRPAQRAVVPQIEEAPAAAAQAGELSPATHA